MEGIKAISEDKSSSHSGGHYSVHKALLVFPFTLQVIVKLINLCVTDNLLLTRWKKIIQIIICKIPGNFELEQIRVIQIIEANINMYLRLI